MAKELRVPTSLLLFVGAGFRRRQGMLWCEVQALNGLRLWAEHFDEVTVVARLEEAEPNDEFAPWTGEEPYSGRIRFVGLPVAWTPVRFARALPDALRRLSPLIERHDRLVFSLGGLVGDWGAVCGLLAWRKGKSFAVWTDRVESDVIRAAARDSRGIRRLKRELEWRIMRRFERFVIRRGTLGLFHGASTYEAYHQLCARSFIVHDCHVPPKDVLTDGPLAQKRREVLEAPERRIVYAGRAASMKGGLDWVEVLGRLNHAGVPFKAEWHGEGDLLQRMKKRAGELELSDRVRFPGFTSDRGALLKALGRAHVCLCCHKTDESPRILIEAMMQGTPLVGYADAFSRDLAEEAEAAVLTPRHQVEPLARALAALWHDRARLAEMMQRARDRGGEFTDEAVFRHRSELIINELSAV